MPSGVSTSRDCQLNAKNGNRISVKISAARAKARASSGVALVPAARASDPVIAAQTSGSHSSRDQLRW